MVFNINNEVPLDRINDVGERLFLGAFLFISDLSPGVVATIEGFAASAGPETILRFRSLGFVKGTFVEVERRLPFGGPIVVRLGGAAFAIEPDAARQISVFLGDKLK